MLIRAATFIVVVSLSGSISIDAATTENPRAAEFERIETELKATQRNARDLKAVGYVENAHGQLDEWTNRLVSRLELGVGPRKSDPIIDGRSSLQVSKLRITYAGYAKSPAVIGAIYALADAHERRLALAGQMLDSRVDRDSYAALSQDIEHLIQIIRTWSHGK